MMRERTSSRAAHLRTALVWLACAAGVVASASSSCDSSAPQEAQVVTLRLGPGADIEIPMSVVAARRAAAPLGTTFLVDARLDAQAGDGAVSLVLLVGDETLDDDTVAGATLDAASPTRRIGSSAPWCDEDECVVDATLFVERIDATDDVVDVTVFVRAVLHLPAGELAAGSVEGLFIDVPEGVQPPLPGKPACGRLELCR